jgi:hypothetical protein
MSTEILLDYQEYIKEDYNAVSICYNRFEKIFIKFLLQKI